MQERLIPTIYMLEKLFAEYNSKLFGNELSMPRFELSHSKRELGRFTCNVTGRNHYGGDEIIMISTRYRYTRYQLLSVLVHEMVHYYLATKGISPAKHGKDFKQMAAKLNQCGEFVISKNIDTTDYEVVDVSIWQKLSWTLFG